MSKIFRIAVASAVLGGVAALTPLSAQAKDATELGASFTAAACSSPTATPANGVITDGRTFTVTMPAGDTAVHEVVARVYTLNADGSKNFSARKTVVENVVGSGGGTVLPGQHIWRVDVGNADDTLAYTSDGFIGCD